MGVNCKVFRGTGVRVCWDWVCEKVFLPLWNWEYSSSSPLFPLTWNRVPSDRVASFWNPCFLIMFPVLLNYQTTPSIYSSILMIELESPQTSVQPTFFIFPEFLFILFFFFSIISTFFLSLIYEIEILDLLLIQMYWSLVQAIKLPGPSNKIL